MSATPTRLDCEVPSVPGSALDEGNRVLESIARQESLRALLAFSGLHEQIRTRRTSSSPNADADIFQTERFVRNEVLQLICDRVQALTAADAVVIAVTEGSEMICRATSGPMPVPRGIPLNSNSAFLRACLESGRIFRCDDSEIDVRVEHDFVRKLGARATVLVPLRGQNERMGVLQAFSSTPWSFTDQDVRCFDLFAELILAALKPEDQDRRVEWLSDIAAEILQAKPTVPSVANNEQVIVGVSDVVPIDTGEGESVKIELEQTPPILPAVIELKTAALEAEKSAESSLDHVKPESIKLDLTAPEPVKLELATGQPSSSQEPQAQVNGESPEPDDAADPGPALLDLESLSQPIEIPVASFELPEAIAEDEKDFEYLAAAIPAQPAPVLPFLKRISLHWRSSPGLTVVMGLVAVAALFSAGVWWGMQVHQQTSPPRIANTPRSVTSPPAPEPDVASPTVSDNLMAPPQSPSQDSPLVPVSESKLAVLPKITGVRHWSSSMGSTVVIDMQDQVPYEVHRLMSPERIYFDLHDTALAPDLDGKTMDVGDVSLTRVRVAQPVSGVTRIVLDTKDGSNFSVSMESNPYRLVVELRDNTRSAAATRPATLVPSAPRAPASPDLAAKSSAPTVPAKTGKFRIVLDAGHGGWDLGTVGRQGLLEKDLVLDVTKRLGKLLQSRLGAEVEFTRTGDDYLPLDQRADFANQAQADLFVSVHANYSSSANARGVETYYTNLFSAPGSKEVEKQTDGSLTQITPVSLSAAGLHEKIDESRRLAASVQRALYATLAAKSPDIRDRGIKDASFVVLTGTTMPSILTEISFVSSPADEHNLQSEAYRQQIAEALYKGIARYEDSAPRAKVAQLHPAAAQR